MNICFTHTQILSLPSNTTDDQPLSAPDPPTCQVMPHGTQDRDSDFHANPRCVGSTDSEHNGNHYGASQGNELLQGPPRRQGEAIHQKPLRAGGDPHPIPHHDGARRIASHHDMIGPQSVRDRRLWCFSRIIPGWYST